MRPGRFNSLMKVSSENSANFRINDQEWDLPAGTGNPSEVKPLRETGVGVAMPSARSFLKPTDKGLGKEVSDMEPKEDPQPPREEHGVKTVATRRILMVIGGILLFSVLAFTISARMRAVADYRAATLLMQDGRYQEALAEFEALEDYKDSQELAAKAKVAMRYADATTLMQSGDYKAAFETFEELGDYGDSKDLAAEARPAWRYATATDLMQSGEYEAALGVFEELGDYKDSREWVDKAREANNDKIYTQAVYLMQNGDCFGARDKFEALGDYKDSRDLAEDMRVAVEERVRAQAAYATWYSGVERAIAPSDVVMDQVLSAMARFAEGSVAVDSSYVAAVATAARRVVAEAEVSLRNLGTPSTLSDAQRKTLSLGLDLLQSSQWHRGMWLTYVMKAMTSYAPEEYVAPTRNQFDQALDDKILAYEKFLAVGTELK